MTRFRWGRKHKYGARKVERDGITFDSKKEAEKYEELKLRLLAKDIAAFTLQPRFELQPSFKKNGKTIRAIHYVADFLVKHLDGREEIIDTKGMKTRDYILKKKLFEYRYPNLTITEE